MVKKQYPLYYDFQKGKIVKTKLKRLGEM